MVTPQEQEAAMSVGGKVNNKEAVKVEDHLVGAARLIGNCAGERALEVFKDSPRLFP